MTQLGALIWLKWRLFRNSMRSRRGVENGIADLLGAFALVVLAVLIAVALGAGAWVEAAAYSRREAAGLDQSGLVRSPLLFLIHTVIFTMWAVVPL